MISILTPIGLVSNIIGVLIIFLSAEKTESPPLNKAFKYWNFKKQAKWGLFLVLIGFGCQFVGAIWPK